MQTDWALEANLAGAVVSEANIIFDTALCGLCSLTTLFVARGTDGSVCNLAGLSLKTPQHTSGTENLSLSHAYALSVRVTEH